MAKLHYKVHPQRSDGKGYIDCPLHRCTSFAVVKHERRRVAGKYQPISTVVSRHYNLNQATLDADYRNRAIVTPARAYKLGKRMQAQVVREEFRAAPYHGWPL